MAVNETTEANPEIGMREDSFESANQSDEGSSGFFSQLENEVNGGIIDNTEATQSQPSGSPQATHDQDTGSNNVEKQTEPNTDWEKRYTDSSREAVKWRDKFKEVEQFVPVLDAMKNDSGLVDHVRDYLTGGGKPSKSIKEKLGIEEDFIFDQQEAMDNPDSDSAKLMNAHVDGLVEQRVKGMLNKDKERAYATQVAQERKKAEIDFRERNNMSDEEFNSFREQAKDHKMTLDDIHYLLNKDKAASNVAQNTKKDMLNQMKNVRSIPTSASGANSQGESKSDDRKIFDNILGFDNQTDNLFG